MTTKSKTLLAGIGILCLLVTAAAPSVTSRLKEHRFRSGFNQAVVALNQEAKKRAEMVPTYEERDLFFVWYVESMQKLIVDQRAQATIKGAKTLDVLSAVYGNIHTVIVDANRARTNRRALEDIQIYEYADDVVFQKATSMMDANVEYLLTRSQYIDTKREEHRQLITNSGLDNEERTELWQPLIPLYESLAAETRKDEQHADRYKTLRRLAEFMNTNKSQYTVDDDGQIMFERVNLLLQFRALAFELETGITSSYKIPDDMQLR